MSPEVKQSQVTGRLRFAGEVPQGLRQNQRVSTRIVLESRDDVLKVQRGSFLDSGGGRVAYVVRGRRRRAHADHAPAPPASAPVEIPRGLEPGDEIIISDLDEFERAETVRLTD